MLTTHKAKKILKAELDRQGLHYDKLSAQTVHFQGLKPAIFVTVHGWKPCPAWQGLKDTAKEHGFFIQA